MKLNEQEEQCVKRLKEENSRKWVIWVAHITCTMSLLLIWNSFGWKIAAVFGIFFIFSALAGNYTRHRELKLINIIEKLQSPEPMGAKGHQDKN